MPVSYTHLDVYKRQGHYKELFEQVRKKGYLYVRVDGEIREALPGMKSVSYTHLPLLF